jgi:hypothetical protein
MIHTESADKVAVSGGVQHSAKHSDNLARMIAQMLRPHRKNSDALRSGFRIRFRGATFGKPILQQFQRFLPKCHALTQTVLI